jgi:uracil-DNA glycosylase
VQEFGARLTSRDAPYAEPSSTLVWRSLYALGVAERVVMWNALALHPFVIGEPRTNRTPTEAELGYGVAPLRVLLEAFPRAAVVAVGKKAAEQLTRLGVAPAAAVRHPANGGARAFAEGMEACVKRRRVT